MALESPNDTLVANFWGGPGTGKSTTAALLFGRMKQRGWNTEIVPEVAKDLVWEERFKTLLFQPYIAAKQMWRVERLRGQVDLVITDGPFLSSLIYLKEEELPGARYFADWLHTVNEEWNQEHIFLKRSAERGYNEAGRYQTQEEAEALDHKIERFLDRAMVPYSTCIIDHSEEANHVDSLVAKIERSLNG
jgi:thymidylate kinase